MVEYPELLLKQCIKCHGDLYLDRDFIDNFYFYSCIQCGNSCYSIIKDQKHPQEHPYNNTNTGFAKRKKRFYTDIS